MNFSLLTALRKQGIMKLYKPFVKSSIKKNFFAYRIINEWNQLPVSTKLSKTLLQFKKNIDNDLQHKMFIIE